MERRQAIKNLGLSFGAFIATPTAISVLQSCGGPSIEQWTPAFFSDEQGKLLRKLLDGILPAVDDFPSATGANVHVFIDKYIDEVMPLEDHSGIAVDLDKLGETLLASAEESDYEDLTDEHVNEFLNGNLKKTEEELQAMDEKMGELFSSGTEPKDFPDDLRSSMLLQNMRSMAIWAYKFDKNVGENVLAYDPVPTKYIGCGDLVELSGGRAWAES